MANVSTQGLSVTFPQADVDRFMRALGRMQQDLGKSSKEAIQWASVKLCGSLSAATKISPKLRKIVANPLFKANKEAGRTRADAMRAKADMRRARFGVMKYNRDGTQRFVPIYRGGEFGAAIRYAEKNGVLLRLSHGKWQKVEAGTDADAFQVPGLMQHPKRVIGRRTMAQKVWKWAQRNTIRGGNGKVFDVPNVGSVRWAGGDAAPQITITNNLRYGVKAFTGGRQTLESSFGRAAGQLEKVIQKRVDAAAVKAAKA
jgi:hypothetical protein